MVRVVGSSNIVLEGDAYTLSCKATGDPVPNVSWIKVSNNQSTHGNILKFTKIDRNDAGDYKCEASNRCGMKAKTETINVSCKYCIMSIWLWFMRKCMKDEAIYYIMYCIMHFKKGKTVLENQSDWKHWGKKETWRPVSTNVLLLMFFNLFLWNCNLTLWL